ncbi:MAG: 50S ribosomal protein L13 [Candidatus Omnitrophica bacterium]|nr:50S ribosomal protein L13 [Candidatus Omnitrophota bacterium]MBI2174461.1 50S ribosomal protein L13 [Candidatus Omnitrophota bacterium]MBI3009929.1 50S ribosomal protein L13 [Candidatus Omnitrophota bacterium]
MTTTIPDIKTFQHRWLLIDAKDQVLGRIASRIALLLRGKHRVTFTPFLDTGDHVVVINVDKVRITGNKLTQKMYQRYSGYPGGQRVKNLQRLMQTHPERALQLAVKGMMPDGPLGRQLLRHLKVYSGTNHPHIAQQPKPVNLQS